MDNAKFTYYDIVGFIIPGAVVFFILYWFITGFLVFPFTIGKDVTDGVAVLIILVAGYFLGHIVHAIGKFVLRDNQNYLLRLCHEALLEENHYSKDYRNHLVTALDQTFMLPPYFAKPTESTSLNTFNDQHLIELFHLTHALIRKANMATNTDTLEAISNMYRGMYACALISTIVCFLISLKQLLLLLALQLIPSVLPNVPFLAFKPSQFFLGVILTLFFITSAVWLLKPRWQDYKRYYIDSLFTNFHILYQIQLNERNPKINNQDD
jgi:hypothetical protein